MYFDDIRRSFLCADIELIKRNKKKTSQSQETHLYVYMNVFATI